MTRWLGVTLCAVLIAACGDDGGTDAGTLDARVPDTGTLDDAGGDDAGGDDAGTDDAGTDDAGADDAGADPCADYAWMMGTFTCTGTPAGRFDCVLVTPGAMGEGTCDLRCMEIDGSGSFSIASLPGGSTVEIMAPTGFMILAPPQTCTKE